jgi:hypothetical protein
MCLQDLLGLGVAVRPAVRSKMILVGLESLDGAQTMCKHGCHEMAQLE